MKLEHVAINVPDAQGFVKFFVDNRTLLEEDHPRCDGSSNVCHHERQKTHRQSAVETWSYNAASHRIPVRFRKNCRWYVHEIEQAENECHPLEGPEGTCAHKQH